eukprot:746229-Hanusia_phi.AAC.2
MHEDEGAGAGAGAGAGGEEEESPLKAPTGSTAQLESLLERQLLPPAVTPWPARCRTRLPSACHGSVLAREALERTEGFGHSCRGG